MGDIAQRGNRLTNKRISKDLVQDVFNVVARKHSLGQQGKPHSSKEGRTASFGRTVRDVKKIFSPERDKKFGGGRTNLLEELGRVEAEPSNRNRRAEISRVHGELNRGYATGGAVRHIKKGIRTLGEAAKKHVARKAFKTHGKDVPTMAAKGGRIGLNKGGKPWGTGPKPGTHEFLMQHLNKPRKKKAIGGPAARAIKGATDRVLKPKGVFKKDRPWEQPPQLRKSQKERREELRKKARKSGGHSKIIFHDEWDKIDPGLQKGLFKKDGGRAGLKKGGKADKNWIQKAVDPKHKGYCTPMTKKTCTPARKALARTFKKKAKTGWG